MPVIPAKPGDWDDLRLKLTRLWLNPKSLDATANLSDEIEGLVLGHMLGTFDESISLDQREAQVLFKADPERIKTVETHQPAIRDAMVAGEILLTVLRISNALQEPASVERALPLVAAKLASQQHPSSRAYMQRVWSAYKSISHFSAAMRAAPQEVWKQLQALRQFQKQKAKAPKFVSRKKNPRAFARWAARFEKQSERVLETFLTSQKVLAATAENIRRLGQKHYPPSRQGRLKVPTLVPEEMWTIAEKDFELPKVKLRLTALSKTEKQLLRRRKQSKG